MTFGNTTQFKKVFQLYSIQEDFDYVYKKNEISWIIAICKLMCGRRIHASPVQRKFTYQIKTFQSVHNCGQQFENYHVTSTFLAEKYFDEIRSDIK